MRTEHSRILCVKYTTGESTSTKSDVPGCNWQSHLPEGMELKQVGKAASERTMDQAEQLQSLSLYFIDLLPAGCIRVVNQGVQTQQVVRICAWQGQDGLVHT